MFVGTGSDVGKSWIATGVCRWFKNRGYKPAPFKAQNMALNSFATPDGHEIGRAQAVQAEACKVECSYLMNPILIKPSGKNQSQIVLNGKPIGVQTAKEYFGSSNRNELFTSAKQAFHKLERNYAPIVLEGAGSISELNLKHRDIVNMRMAKEANADVYLIADIDRGGVFASIYGSIKLLEPWERELIKGIIINKFRGDASLFEEGKKIIEKLTSVPVLGVVPFAPTIHIEEEDSVALSKKNHKPQSGVKNIAVVHLHYMANYTDFDALESNDGINVFYTRNPDHLQEADVIVIPGTKNTIDDMVSLREENLDNMLLTESSKKPIIGICGGYQMMGKEISDPFGVESQRKTVPGIGIFDISTTLEKEKRTEQVKFKFKDFDDDCLGYEIHMGTTNRNQLPALNKTENSVEGVDNGICWGTYIHGIFDNQIVVKDLFNSLGIVDQFNESKLSTKEQKDLHYNKLAAHLENHLDMESILNQSKQC